MSSPLGNLGADQFLAEYWQKKPCLIRDAIPGFEPLLGGDDLAGLACEEMSEARLVTGRFEASDWTVRHGPFDDSVFAELPEENWTLLVQDVEKHYAPLQELMRQFNFIPNWRLDDLMISYAANGGSVGPHTDQYDVFLLQAEGRRLWQIAHTFDPRLQEDCPLNVLKEFEAEQEWVLEPGDILYLPPDVAHHGIALEPGMTWSIGSRAPSGADLLQGLGEWLAFTADEGGRYADPDLTPARQAGEIAPEALDGLRDLMRSGLEKSESLDNFLGTFMSRFRLAHEPVPPPDQLSPDELLEGLGRGQQLHRNPWTRLTWIRLSSGARLFAAGQPYDCSVWLAESLCETAQLRVPIDRVDEASLETLSRLINNGHFVLAHV